MIYEASKFNTNVHRFCNHQPKYYQILSAPTLDNFVDESYQYTLLLLDGLMIYVNGKISIQIHRCYDHLVF